MLVVVAPIDILLIVPAVAGLMVTTPVLVGDITTLALAGERVTAPLAVSVVNAPVLVVVAPMDMRLMVPAVAGLMVTTPVPVGDSTTLAFAGERVTAAEAPSVVNKPAAAVVAPTVPLMLMLAVPVRLVTVPLDGVPRAPLKVTKAPAEPTATPRAVTTPVPVVVVAGAAPAPPPRTIALAVRAAEVAHVVALEK